jgi:hypothetical protein
MACRATHDVEDRGGGRRDRPGHLDSVGQELGIGYVGLLMDVSGIVDLSPIALPARRRRACGLRDTTYPELLTRVTIVI